MDRVDLEMYNKGEELVDERIRQYYDGEPTLDEYYDCMQDLAKRAYEDEGYLPNYKKLTIEEAYFLLTFFYNIDIAEDMVEYMKEWAVA